MYRTIATSLIIATLTAAAASDASAQERFNVDTLDPLHAQGTNLLRLGKSEVLGHLKPAFGLFVHYQDDPLQVVTESDSTVQARLLDHQLKAEFSAALGLFDWVDVGVILPLVLTQSGEGSDAFAVEGFDGFALSDLRVVPKLRILDQEKFGGFGLGLMVPVHLPTGDSDTFNGDDGVRAEPRIVADFTTDYVTIVANLGVQLRPERVAQNHVSGNAFTYGLGAQIPIVDPVSLIGNFYGSVGLQEGRNPSNLSEAAANSRARPMEVLGGVQLDLPASIVAQLGAGAGLNDSIGSPDFRLFASLGYTPRASDRDGDGIADGKDSCPDEPEDRDKFEDSDGCPDEDNDGDGILDTDDQCPNDPEDADGFEDDNGCPDPDNDGDGILDVDDACPMEPGVPENEGCPNIDTDGDGLFDPDDQCPQDPEDKDGFEDEDGCPDPDNDRDGILDPDDKCPLEKEVINGKDDDDGCPDEGESKVRVTDKKIEILDKVYFDTNKDTIQERSYNVLNQVASILKANPQITKVHVEGHTDSRGRDSYNLDLSKRRAASVVRYLTGRGIADTRLDSEGYGETKPVADNKSKAGREKNRRVEFQIVEVNGKPVKETTEVESK